MGKYTQEEYRILAVCEKGRLAILAEEVRRWEAGMEELSGFQRVIIYQRYRDKVVDKYPSAKWEEISDLYDKLYEENANAHTEDALAYI